jgi:hypothetical protein
MDMTFGLIVCEGKMPIINSVFSEVFKPPVENTNWQPTNLFPAGTIGYWYDPSDITTLFQDNLGATPVTAAGQTVGRILDKSGNGYHATQATLAQRPLYQIDASGRPYLSFDGVDDNLVIPAMTIVGTEPLFLCLGVARLLNTSVTTIVSFGKGGASTTYPGFSLLVRGSSAPAYAPQLQTASGTVNNNLLGFGSTFGSAATRVISATKTGFRINNSGIGTSGSSVDFTGFGTQNNRLGCNYNFANNNFWKNGIYSAIFAAISVVDNQITSAQNWTNNKTGAY